MIKQIMVWSILFSTVANAQPILKSLKPGDTIPDVGWGEFIHQPLAGKPSDIK